MISYREIIEEERRKLNRNINWWPLYLYHFTDVHNAISIIDKEYIFGRKLANDENLMTSDNASSNVIEITDERVLRYARLYMRPKTPTQFHNEGHKPEYIINPCSGVRIEVTKGQQIEIVDIEGGQVVDFFAEMKGDSTEFISPGVTIDCNESLRLHVGDLIYSNKYKPMFKILYDDVKEHDLLHPCCRPEMYAFFYHNGENHPNCFDNINQALGTSHPIIRPVNLFMYTKVNSDGSIEVHEPLSKANDRIVLEAIEDMALGIAACSVLESSCNSGKCTAIKIIVG